MHPNLGLSLAIQKNKSFPLLSRSPEPRREPFLALLHIILPDLLCLSRLGLLGLALLPHQPGQILGLLLDLLRYLRFWRRGDPQCGIDVDGWLAQIYQALLHVGQHLLDVGDLATGGLIVVWAVQGGELDLLVLELELGAVDGGFEGRGGLVAEALVDVFRFAAAGGVIRGFGGRGELEG